jgi:hypothetical protein
MANMKKILASFVVCLLLVSIPVAAPNQMEQLEQDVSSVSVDDQDAQLSVQIVGSLRILRWNMCGFTIINEGNITAHSVSYTFKVSGAANFSNTDNIGDIPAAWALGVVFPGCVHGFGGITITVTVQSSDTGEVIETARGLQLGGMTLVFG